MFNGAILGEDDLETPKTAVKKSSSAFWSGLGTAAKKALSTGADVYKSSLDAKAASAKAKAESLINQRALLAQSQAPARSSFPVIPVIAGVGLIGVIAFVLMQRRRR